MTGQIQTRDPPQLDGVGDVKGFQSSCHSQHGDSKFLAFPNRGSYRLPLGTPWRVLVLSLPVGSTRFRNHPPKTSPWSGPGDQDQVPPQPVRAGVGAFQVSHSPSLARHPGTIHTWKLRVVLARTRGEVCRVVEAFAPVP